MRLHILQHVPFEGPALIESWARAKGYSLDFSHLYDGEVLPALSEFDMLVVMGGPMSVHDVDAYPWLRSEKQFIRTAIDAGKYVLGICLGAQLIAIALEGQVAPHEHKEIGWFPITVKDEVKAYKLFQGMDFPLKVFHWHGERFTLPEGAVHLLESEACDHQAFLYREKVLALQFHLEMDEAAVARIIAACGDEISPAPFIQYAATMQDLAKGNPTAEVLNKLLDDWQG